MALLVPSSTFVEPSDLLESPQLPSSASATRPLSSEDREDVTPQGIIDSCCDRHQRATAAVSELQAVCQELVRSTAASEATLSAIKNALQPYDDIENCPNHLNIASPTSCSAHLRLLQAVQQLAASQRAEAVKFRARGEETARSHRAKLLQTATNVMNQWAALPAVSSAKSLSAEVAALQAGVAASPLSRATCLLRLSSATADALEAEDAAVVAVSEHFFAVRQEMLQRWALPAPDGASAPQLCAVLRQALDALRQEAALHNSILRNKQHLDALQVQPLCPTQRALLQLPGEEAAAAAGMAALAGLLLAPLATAAARPSSVGELAEIMASMRDELAVMSSSCSSLEETAAAGALSGAAEDLLLSAVQERLMYAAERDITDALAAWQPSAPSDVAFPQRFETYRRSVAQRAAGAAGGAGSPPVACDVTHTWFPPMYRCLRALSSLYRALTRGAFATCAQQAVAQLLAAMGRAGVAIAAKHGALHGQLFLISQLLILREQLAPFDVSLAATQHHLALPSASAALGTLVRGLPGLLKWGEGNLLYDLLTGRMMPALVQVHTDGRRDLESSLKSACERFIGLQSSALAAPLTPLIPQGGTPDWEHAEDVLSKWAAVFRRDFPHLRRQLALYLGSAVTHRILLTPIADSVSQVLNKARAAATSAQTAPATAAADAIRGALATVTGAMDEDDEHFDPHLPQYWAQHASS